MKFILGTKQKMTQYFSETGDLTPVTVVSAGPITITRVFEKSNNGYDSIQCGFGIQKESRLSKPELGQRSGTPHRILKEFRLKNDIDKFNVNDVIDVSVFSVGDKVQVSGISKGKGFQGVVKRHGFHGGPRTHGQKHSEREPGSIGGGLRTRVPKGMRMAGRMGSDRITQKNLKIVYISKEDNLMFLKGAIPGRRGTLVEIIKK